MKIRILALAITALTLNNSFAQKFELGIKGGADLNKIQGQSFTNKFTFGYHLGAFAQIGLTGKLVIQPELYYSQINKDTATSFSTVYQSIPKLSLGYLNIPILLSYKPAKFLAIQAGPKFGIVTNSNLSFLNNTGNAFRNGDLSFVGGVQLHFANIRIYGRYEVGLTNINDLDNQDKWKSQSIHAGVGFRLL
ncbi:MAG: PorT family protein [Ferruginibacter sp.]|nr:PorT family protein [Ferruginibacter sp.]